MQSFLVLLQPAYVVHIFPPCEFTQSILAQQTMELVTMLREIPYVVIIITTCS